MRSPTFVFGLIAIAAVGIVWAEDFPLTFRTIPAQDVLSFPGGLASEPLTSSKPVTLTKESKATSRHPLYGALYGAQGTVVFRLDESKGTGTGYDQLIMDMNQNGDLGDDAVAPRVEILSASRNLEELTFGPIQAPADKLVAGGRPVYYAQVYLLDGRTQAVLTGRLMLKTGWYLDTSLKLNGFEQMVGVFDGDCNLRLGDIWRSRSARDSREPTWYFQAGDYLLIDANGSGAFESDVLESEVCPFGPILYLGSDAYRVELSADYKSLRVEPWMEPLAQVTLEPRSNQVHSVTLAWERAKDQWQLIKPAVTNGTVMVPPGNYRLYACILLGKGRSGEQVMLSGTQRIPQRPTSVKAGQVHTMACGGPLQIEVAAAGVAGSFAGSAGEEYSLPWARSDTPLRISASVLGAGGEIYFSFLVGPRFKSPPPKPTFSVTEAGGKLLASGNLVLTCNDTRYIV